MRTRALSDGKGGEGLPAARLGPHGSETGHARGLSGPSTELRRGAGGKKKKTRPSWGEWGALG